MSVNTLYKFLKIAGAVQTNQITDEVYTDVGSDTFQLGTVKRAFLGAADLMIRTAAAGGGDLLVEDVDYEVLEEDFDYTEECGFHVYTGISILTGAYQSGDLYFTYKTIGSYTDADVFNDSIAAIAALQDEILSRPIGVKTAAADYTVLDDDGYGTIIIDTRTGDKTVTLPTLADNLGREITIVASHDGGALIVDGEGAETIDGNATFKILNQYGYCKIKATSDGWIILSCQSIFSTGWINTNDWTDRTLGNINLTYDNLSGTFAVGEVVREYSDAGRTTPTGKYGIVMSNSGTVLVLMKVGGGGTFTNDYYLKGDTSLATAQVNGATKNADTNLYHGMGRNMSELAFRPYYSTDGTENNTYHAYVAFQGGNAEVGTILKQVDTNTITAQTGEYGAFLHFDSNGNYAYWDADDYYYQIKLVYQK